MLTKLEIRNFRCFEELRLDELRRVNLIAGKNNVGKTSLLETLFLLSAGSNAGHSFNKHVLRRASLPMEQMEPKEVWGRLFPDQNFSRPIHLAAQADNGKENLALELSLGEAETRVQTDPSGMRRTVLGGLQHQSTRNEKTTSVQVSVVREEHGDRPPTSSIVAPGGIPFLPCIICAASREHTAEDADRYNKLDKSNERESIQKILDALRLLEPRLKRLSLDPRGGGSIWGELQEIKSLLPLPDMGAGMVRLFSILASLYSNTHGIVLVDEIENGIHHSVLPKVWQALHQAARQADVQIFATTHSYECIQAAAEVFAATPDDLALYRLERVQEKIKAVRFEPEILKTAIDSFLEVR